MRIREKLHAESPLAIPLAPVLLPAKAHTYIILLNYNLPEIVHGNDHKAQNEGKDEASDSQALQLHLEASFGVATLPAEFKSGRGRRRW
jgi:hypothetical protein